MIDCHLPGRRANLELSISSLCFDILEVNKNKYLEINFFFIGYT